jgi:hypothetical protein
LLSLPRPGTLVGGGIRKVEEGVGREHVESYGDRMGVIGRMEGIFATSIPASTFRERMSASDQAGGAKS